jgi:hypothetical protein
MIWLVVGIAAFVVFGIVSLVLHDATSEPEDWERHYYD